MPDDDDIVLAISFELSREDVVAFLTHQAERSAALDRSIRATKRSAATIYGLFVLLGGVLTALLVDDHRAIGGAIGLVATAVVGLFLFRPWSWNRMFRQRYVKAVGKSVRGGDLDHATGPRRVVVADGHVREDCDQGETRVFWTAIERLDETPEHLFLYTSPNTAFVMPRSAFPAEAAIDRFRAAIEERLPAHRSAAHPPTTVNG